MLRLASEYMRDYADGRRKRTYGFPVGAIVGLEGSTFEVSTAFVSSFAVAKKRENAGDVDPLEEGAAIRAARLEPA
jgi:hypothetical protein